MPRKRRDIPWPEWRGETAYVCWYNADTRRTERISLRTTDPVEAQKRYAAFLIDGHDVLAGRPRGGSSELTLGQALDDYWREHVAKKVVDTKRVENIIVQLKAGFGADVPIKDIDIARCEDYTDRRRKQSFAKGTRRSAACDATIRRELTTISAAANHEVRRKRLQRNDLPVVETPSGYVLEAIDADKWLTVEEWNRALAAATGNLRHFMVICYDTASRRRAVERLRLSQIDLKNSHVNLTAPDEDENQRRSRKRRPVVPISSFARPSYEALMMLTTTEWLFETPKNWFYEYTKHMEAVGLGHKSNPHILRHSRATHLLQDGVDIYAVAKLLGDTVATVEKVYGHHSQTYLAKALKDKAG